MRYHIGNVKAIGEREREREGEGGETDFLKWVDDKDSFNRPT